MKQGLNKKVSESACESDCLIISPMQVVTNQSSTKTQLSYYHHQKNDSAFSFKKKSFSQISYSQMVQELKNIVTKLPVNGKAYKSFLMKNSNIFAITGEHGVGKTAMINALVKDLRRFSVNNPVIVFFIHLQDLVYTKQTDLLEFLAPFLRSKSFWSNRNRQIILEEIEKCNKVFIVMDSLHYADIELSKIGEQKKCSINAIATAEKFISNLLAGNILPRSKKIIASTPSKLFQLPKSFQPKVLCTVQGINENAVKLMCDKISSEEAQFENLSRYLVCYPKLKSYCYNPTICTMVLNYLKAMPNISRSVASHAETLTDIFIFFLKADKSLGACVKMLSDAVFEDFHKEQICFQDYKLYSVFSEKINNLFRLQSIFKNERRIPNFIWQDFLVSLKLRLYVNKDEWKKILRDLASEKYKMITSFLFGLCNERSLEYLLSFVGEKGLNSTIDREEIKKMLKQFAIEQLQQTHHSNLDKDKTTKLFNHCIYFSLILPVLGWLREMNDYDFTKQAAENLLDEIFVYNCQIFPSDVPNIIDVFRARRSSLAVRIIFPGFFEECYRYFFKEIYTTLRQNPNIKVSIS